MLFEDWRKTHNCHFPMTEAVWEASMYANADTAQNNVAAQKYYEKCAFDNEGITRSYYTK